MSKIINRLMPRRAIRREFRRQAAAMRAEGCALDQGTARIWAKWGYRAPGDSSSKEG